MNRTHRIIWSASRNAFIVTSEGAKAEGKPSSTRKAIVVAVPSTLGSLAAMPALANTSCPGGGLPFGIGGVETSTCTLATGDSLTVDMGASINASTHGVVAVSSNVGSISNSGSIFGSRVGITLGSSTAGSISGSTYVGIFLNSGSITNYGTISGGRSAGIALYNSTVTGRITNSRLIPYSAFLL